jgi:hypothetical protein
MTGSPPARQFHCRVGAGAVVGARALIARPGSLGPCSRSSQENGRNRAYVRQSRIGVIGVPLAAYRTAAAQGAVSDG